MPRLVRVQEKKKKVLSNTQLTRKVRALEGTEGNRAVDEGGYIYSAVALTAGTADINYFDAVGAFAEQNRKHHYYTAWMKFVTTNAAGATLRIIFGYDEMYDGTPLTDAEILSTVTDSASEYARTNNPVATLKEARHKNRSRDYRAVIVEDMLIPLVANEPKAFKKILPMFNRLSKQINVEGNFYPFMLLLCDEGAVTATVAVTEAYTNLG